jgi:hypothetical protein
MHSIGISGRISFYLQCMPGGLFMKAGALCYAGMHSNLLLRSPDIMLQQLLRCVRASGLVLSRQHCSDDAAAHVALAAEK